MTAAIPEDLSAAVGGFIESRFPESVSYGSSGGPGFKTSVFTVDSGIAHANAEWTRLRGKYTVEFDGVSEEDINAVCAFFYVARGMALGFRYKDWSDYQLTDQYVLVGNGVDVTFQISKRYQSGPAYFNRPIRKLVPGTVSPLVLNGSPLTLGDDYTINPNNGTITMSTPPVSGAVGFIEYAEFDVPVRFNTDTLSVSCTDFNQYSISGLDLIEILT